MHDGSTFQVSSGVSHLSPTDHLKKRMRQMQHDSHSPNIQVGRASHAVEEEPDDNSSIMPP